MPDAMLQINIANGKFIQEMDIQLPDDERDFTWKENIRNRELVIELYIAEMKVLYRNQIAKLGVEPQFCIYCMGECITKYNSVRKYKAGKLLKTENDHGTE
jgi:hypothetical protein